jgi:hypothetical protein
MTAKRLSADGLETILRDVMGPAGFPLASIRLRGHIDALEAELAASRGWLENYTAYEQETGKLVADLTADCGRLKAECERLRGLLKAEPDWEPCCRGCGCMVGHTRDCNDPVYVKDVDLSAETKASQT